MPNQHSRVWDRKRVDEVVVALKKGPSVADVATRFHSSPSALRDLFSRHKLPSPSSFLPPKSKAPDGESSILTDDARRIFDALRKKPVKFTDLCDRLNASPSATRAMLEDARREGMRVRVEHDHVGLGADDESPEELCDLKIKPVVGQQQRIAAISDLHYGSKYCLDDRIEDFVDHAHDLGVREILVGGDCLDGVYRHSLFEQRAVGAQAQADEMRERLPKRRDLRYWMITGNHDETFFSATGVDVGEYVVDRFRDAGRDDLAYVGRRSAFVRIRGVIVNLWHPRTPPAYAKSYILQKKSEGYGYIKPQVLLTGHQHTFCYVNDRSVQAILMPCFQGGGGMRGSEFGNSLAGNPTIGGLLLSWSLTADGTMRDFGLSPRFYYERERPVDVYNPIDAEPIDLDERRAKSRRSRG